MSDRTNWNAPMGGTTQAIVREYATRILTVEAERDALRAQLHAAEAARDAAVEALWWVRDRAYSNSCGVASCNHVDVGCEILTYLTPVLAAAPAPTPGGAAGVFAAAHAWYRARLALVAATRPGTDWQQAYDAMDEAERGLCAALAAPTGGGEGTPDRTAAIVAAAHLGIEALAGFIDALDEDGNVPNEDGDPTPDDWYAEWSLSTLTLKQLWRAHKALRAAVAAGRGEGRDEQRSFTGHD